MHQNRKGIQFGFKDTFSLDVALSPIILSALKKFKEVTTDPKRKTWVGVKGDVLKELYPDHKYDYTEEELKVATQYWLDILDKMIYAFDLKNEPNLKDYNFKFKTWSKKLEGRDLSEFHIEPTNKEEYDRYRKDEEDHWKKVEEGHLLLGKFYRALWW